MSCFTCLWATNGSMRKFFRIPLAFPTYETQLNQNNFTTNYPSSKAETQKISKHTFIKYYMKTRSCGSVTGNSCYLKMTSNRLKINLWGGGGLLCYWRQEYNSDIVRAFGLAVIKSPVKATGNTVTKGWQSAPSR